MLKMSVLPCLQKTLSWDVKCWYQDIYSMVQFLPVARSWFDPETSCLTRLHTDWWPVGTLCKDKKIMLAVYKKVFQDYKRNVSSFLQKFSFLKLFHKTAPPRKTSTWLKWSAMLNNKNIWEKKKKEKKEESVKKKMQDALNKYVY